MSKYIHFADEQKQCANSVDRKRARELREKRQAQGHARDEQVRSY